MKKLLKLLGILLLIVVILAALLIGVLSVAEYRPADREPVAVSGAAAGERTGLPRNYLSKRYYSISAASVICVIIQLFG